MFIHQKAGLASIAFLVALTLTSNATVAFAEIKKVDIDVSKLPNSVLTTIADVKADGDGANVYANNDIRVLRINPDSKKMIDEAILAKKNGWEVKIAVKPTSSGRDFEITSLQIKSRKNVLTSGFNMPDTKFSPIIARSSREAQDLFKSVYPYKSDNYDANDNCYNRAQYWSRMHQVSQKSQGSSKGTDKVFIFFTDEYRRKYDHKWWYHVAPMIYVGDKSNPVVLDPTFMSSAISLNDWLSAFDHHTEGNCVRVETIDQYYSYSNQPVCLYITASMFNYSPTDLRADRMTNWRCSDFDRVKAAIPAPGSMTFSRSATWSDPKNLFIIPEMCGGPAIPANVIPTPTPETDSGATPIDDNKPESGNLPNAVDWKARVVGEGDAVNLYAGPGDTHQILGRIPTNSLVNFVPTGSEWLEVVVPAGIIGADVVRGYLPKNQIQMVR